MKIGVDLGGSHIAVGVLDEKGVILEKEEKRLISVDKRDIRKNIEEYLIEKVTQLLAKYTITEMGIGAPGWAQNGVMISSGKLGIKNYPIVERLQEKIQLPIKLRNDAKCAGLAENKYGCLKGYDRSVFLTLGTGIGGAVFLHNQLLTGGEKPGYEFGHMIIEKNGIACNCGKKGCFEKYASMKILKDNLRKVLNLDENTSGKQLLEMIRRNIPENENYEIIEKVVSQFIENLGIGIQNLICIFEPEVIGIGGSFVYFEEVLLERLKKQIQKYAQSDCQRKKIKIQTAILGNDAGIIGSVL